MGRVLKSHSYRNPKMVSISRYPDVYLMKKCMSSCWLPISEVVIFHCAATNQEEEQILAVIWGHFISYAGLHQKIHKQEQCS